MKKNKLSRLMAYILTLCMMVSMFSGLTLTVNAESEPSATSVEGIEFSKTAQVNDDGTTDIIMEAYTTGTVTNSESSVPADIVLVLDMSGSMENASTHSPSDIEILGITWTPLVSPRYGFRDEGRPYYILNGSGEPVRVTFVDYDDSSLGIDVGHQYYTDGTNYYYPKLEDGVRTSNRRRNYEEKQFYRYKTHMEILKEGASAFIADTAAKNATIENEADKHRISIVKFATADYYNGSSATDDYVEAVIGDNRASNNYNYTQVVKDLTVVDDDGKTELTNALNNLQAGGATAVDYGLQLAEKVLGDREVSVGRSEAIIVFTDGSPTHSSDYEEKVAGDTIEKALALKNAGVKIFSIGGADTADSSVLGDDSNKFMHYISNNFPYADYSDENIIPGTGDINGGYYMTPSDDRNLESIFRDIFKQTVELDISMGTTAGVIDSISPYFTIPDGANSITLQVAEKTASGWGSPTTAVGVTPTINGNTLTVRGFDFDANYVSESPRQVDGAEFYGKKLIITINVAPDYDEIDLHKASFTNGLIPTNEGPALVVNSSNETVISKESPVVKARKVTYMVDNEEYAYFYRFPNTSVDVINNPTKVGHNFSGWDRTGTFVMPDADVVISGTFSPISYKVNYVYSGTVPDASTGVTPLPAEKEYLYGTKVYLEDKATASGYNFVGWTPQQENIAIQIDPENNKEYFMMPANNVRLIGYFMAERNTPYKIEHYRETFNDNEFELFETEADKFGETGKIATAQPKAYEGFTFDSSRNADLSGRIEADNPLTPEDETLVLKVYYTRNDVTVTYEFDGDVPSGITPPSSVTKKYGESYTVEEAMTVPGYDFIGWYYTSDLTYTDISGDTIIVDRDIYLAGEFTAKTDTVYTVEHWIQNIDDDNYTKRDSFTEILTGTTDTDVTAYARTITGVYLNATETEDNLDSGQILDTTGVISSITANIDRNGNTVIKFYYDRMEYTVTYRFEGTVPADAPDTDALKQENIRYGKTVIVDTTIPNGPMPVGYVGFFGWYRGAALDSNLVDADFVMPARDVELLGYFIPSDNTIYTVRHFLQNAEDDDYTEDESRKETFRGKTLQNVTAYPLPTILGLGYIYNGEDSTDSGQVLADGSLELLLYYDREEYPVTYRYINAPEGADSSLTGSDGNYRHGKAVEYKQAPDHVPGYTFHGWRVQDGDIETTTNGFIMPNRAVTVYGMWTPNSNTSYKVEHYYEGLNGNYGDGEGATTPKFIETQHTGTTGHTVTAAEIPQLGFTLNPSHSEAVMSGTIKGDGTTTLKLYYARNVYDVSYIYSGAMPNATFETKANELLPSDSGNPFRVKYGDEYSIQEVIDPAVYPELAGYTFHGWTPNDTVLVVTDNKFTMPAHNVELVGHFHADTDTPYKIEHYLELRGGGYPAVAQYSENRPGETNSYATVYARKFEGFTFDEATTGTYVNTGAGETLEHVDDYYIITKQIAGTGTTEFKFYYNRNKNTVTYEFDGLQPHGINSLEHEATMDSYNQSNVYYGTDVIVKNDLEQAGYDFTGWYSEDPAIGESDASFTMPDKPVVLKGRFTARDDTQYKVQYHLQKLNTEETDVAGTNKATDYELQDADTFNGTGTTGHLATAEVKRYVGFVARTDNVITATILGDGTTVIDIYYDRVINPISYHFYGTAQEHTDADLPAVENNVPYGAKRQVAPEIACDSTHRHEFTGWGSPHVTPVEGEYTMPATRVQFFTSARNKYSVIYDLDGGTGAEGVAYTPFDVLAGTVIDMKPAPAKVSYTFTGWKLDGTENIYNPDDEITVNEDIKLIAQYNYNGGGGVPGGGGGSTRYTLTYNTNGGNDIPKETHTSGNTVKLTKEPEKEGYIFDGWHLDAELTEDVSEVKMTKNITVYAAWVEDNGNAGNGHPTPGALNGQEHFAYVIGYPDGTVRPDDNITRAEVTSIFFRLLKEEIREANLTSTSSYVDVVSGEWFNTAIATMTKLGIVKGRYEGKFVPDANITRAEFAVICARFDDSEFEIADDFADVDGHWAESEIHEAAAHGWIRGYEDNTFKPDQYITRAEAMTMINRVLNRIPEKVNDLHPDMIKWFDNNNINEWYYIAIQEATNSHEYEMKNSIYEVWTKLTEVEDWAAYAK